MAIRNSAVGAFVAGALAACTGTNNVNLSAQAPLHVDNGALSIDTASASDAGALSAADWSAFNGKVSAVSAGTAIAIAGTATAPQISVALGTDANTAAAGNDPRFADSRAPAPGSGNYIQNGTTPQQASFNVAGNGQVSALSIGTAAPNAEDVIPGTLEIVGNTSWTLSANEAKTLELIDVTSHVRRATFDTSGNFTIGGVIACAGGCNAGIEFSNADQQVWVRGPVSSQSGRAQRDAVVFDPGANDDGSPVHIKTNIVANEVPAFRFNVEGYNWGSDTLIDSACAGTFVTAGLTGHGCTDKSAGAATTLYVSSDNFLVVKVTGTLASAGFTLSAAYYGSYIQTSELHPAYVVLRGTNNY